MKPITFAFPVALFGAALWIKVTWPEAYTALIQEDSALEDIQAATYFMAFLLSTRLTTRFAKSGTVPLLTVLYGILSVGLLFITFEELSWGQRLLGIPTPDWFMARNAQHELSIHNLFVVQQYLINIYIAVGAFGAFGWLAVRSLPVASNPVIRDFVRFVIPEWHVSSFFFLHGLIYASFVITPPELGGFMVWRDQEVSELMLSLGFLAFVVSNQMRLTREAHGLIDLTRLTPSY